MGRSYVDPLSFLSFQASSVFKQDLTERDLQDLIFNNKKRIIVVFFHVWLFIP